MEPRFKKKSQILDVGITAVAAVLSVGVMLYGVSHFGLGEAWPELVLNLCYIACLAMMELYFFKRLDSQRFNYWSSVCAGITVLLRDILFPPPLAVEYVREALTKRRIHSRATTRALLNVARQENQVNLQVYNR